MGRAVPEKAEVTGSLLIDLTEVAPTTCWPPCSPAAAEEHLAQTAAIVSSLHHGLVQRGCALQADTPDSAATEELPNREKY